MFDTQPEKEYLLKLDEIKKDIMRNARGLS